MLATSFRELNVYKEAMAVAVELFDLTKDYPPDEKYSLTDQIRRSSRSVCANVAEVWRKRRYRNAFIAKLSDSEAECAETQVWLDFSLKHNYINEYTYKKFDDKCDKIAGMLVQMIIKANTWVTK